MGRHCDVITAICHAIAISAIERSSKFGESKRRGRDARFLQRLAQIKQVPGDEGCIAIRKIAVRCYPDRYVSDSGGAELRQDLLRRQVT